MKQRNNLNPYYKGTQSYKDYENSHATTLLRWHGVDDTPRVNERVLVVTSEVTTQQVSTATYNGDGSYYVDHCAINHPASEVIMWSSLDELKR